MQVNKKIQFATIHIIERDDIAQVVLQDTCDMFTKISLVKKRMFPIKKKGNILF